MKRRIEMDSNDFHRTTFLVLQGYFKCPDCGQEQPVDIEFEGDPSCHDSGMYVKCECGTEMNLTTDFE